MRSTSRATSFEPQYTYARIYYTHIYLYICINNVNVCISFYLTTIRYSFTICVTLFNSKEKLICQNIWETLMDTRHKETGSKTDFFQFGYLNTSSHCSWNRARNYVEMGTNAHYSARLRGRYGNVVVVATDSIINCHADSLYCLNFVYSLLFFCCYFCCCHCCYNGRCFCCWQGWWHLCCLNVPFFPPFEANVCSFSVCVCVSLSSLSLNQKPNIKN